MVGSHLQNIELTGKDKRRTKKIQKGINLLNESNVSFGVICVVTGSSPFLLLVNSITFFVN